VPAKEYVPWVATAMAPCRSLEPPMWTAPDADAFAGSTSSADILPALVRSLAS
jgi:hypothetical protein